jgi:hypothetical protein
LRADRVRSGLCGDAEPARELLSLRRLPGGGLEWREVASALAAEVLLAALPMALLSAAGMRYTLATATADDGVAGGDGTEPRLLRMPGMFRLGGVPGVVCAVLLPPLWPMLELALALMLLSRVLQPLLLELPELGNDGSPPVIIVRGSGATHCNARARVSALTNFFSQWFLREVCYGSSPRLCSWTRHRG